MRQIRNIFKKGAAKNIGVIMKKTIVILLIMLSYLTDASAANEIKIAKKIGIERVLLCFTVGALVEADAQYFQKDAAKVGSAVKDVYLILLDTFPPDEVEYLRGRTNFTMPAEKSLKEAYKCGKDNSVNELIKEYYPEFNN